MDDTTKKPKITCPLCESPCNYDSRGEWRATALVTLLFGWFALPILGMLLVKLPQLDKDAGLLLGFAAWPVLTIWLARLPVRWICSSCGATFPAVKLAKKK